MFNLRTIIHVKNCDKISLMHIILRSWLLKIVPFMHLIIIIFLAIHRHLSKQQTHQE